MNLTHSKKSLQEASPENSNFQNNYSKNHGAKYKKSLYDFRLRKIYNQIKCENFFVAICLILFCSFSIGSANRKNYPQENSLV